MQDVPELVTGDVPPHLLVAYKAVPPACYYLSRYCLDLINSQRVSEGQEPGRIVHVYKNKVATTDYANASGTDRARELRMIDISLEGRDISGLPVTVLDDIRITGTAERRILEVVRPACPSSITLGYIAVFDTDQAAMNPSIEYDLNTAVISGIDSVGKLISRNDFVLNIRTLKLILGSDPEELASFLQDVPASMLEEMIRGSVDTGPSFVAQYRNGFSLLRAAAKERIIAYE